ncbi:hypothetical protein L3Q82_011430 [Scortum barcoo]|uniref:Uncharacterized protein n=1 Tax=Scortum barcoo TaxID=214431 RepID=A0ACB8W9S1_9TELE|nr:hypothetical protein L3Q82_011430 [Scortum barcoo]
MSHREEASGKTQDTLERLCLSRLAWERLGVPPEELEEVSGVREVWASLLRLLPPCDPVPDQADENGWMDGWMDVCLLASVGGRLQRRSAVLLFGGCKSERCSSSESWPPASPSVLHSASPAAKRSETDIGFEAPSVTSLPVPSFCRILQLSVSCHLK